MFGDAAPPVTSTKGVTGHMIAGAGAAEAVISLLSLRDGRGAADRQPRRRSATTSASTSSPASPRPIARTPVLSNSFGFGGHNATLILGPVDLDDG